MTLAQTLTLRVALDRAYRAGLDGSDPWGLDDVTAIDRVVRGPRLPAGPAAYADLVDAHVSVVLAALELYADDAGRPWTACEVDSDGNPIAWRRVEEALTRLRYVLPGGIDAYRIGAVGTAPTP